MPRHLIDEDWEDYDNRKIRDNRDRSKFSCDEPWEVSYLVQKIKRLYPHLNDSAIRNAISSCCGEVRAPRPRKEFVECVRGKLLI